MKKKYVIFVSIALLFSGWLVGGTAQAEEAIVAPFQTVAKPNHQIWNSLTAQFVSITGEVDYPAMKRHTAQLKTYLDDLNLTAPNKEWSKNEELAYWINLYNASTVYLIVSNYPLSSITNLSGGKPWDKKFILSGNNVYSLNQIENEIVRPKFKDPRIHAALNCAAVSCPKLLNEAYLPQTLHAQLEQQTKAWVNDITKNKLTPSKVRVSQIFEWYAADFKAGGGVLQFLSKYSNKKFILDPKAKINYLEYNWALNE